MPGSSTKASVNQTSSCSSQNGCGQNGPVVDGGGQSCAEHRQSIRLSPSSRTGQSAGQGLCLRCWIRFVSQHLSRRKFLNWESSHQLIDVYRFTRKRRPNGRRTKGSTAWQPTESCYFSQKENSKEAQRRLVAGSKSLWEEPCTIWGTRDQHLKRNPKYFLP